MVFAYFSRSCQVRCDRRGKVILEFPYALSALSPASKPPKENDLDHMSRIDVKLHNTSALVREIYEKQPKFDIIETIFESCVSEQNTLVFSRHQNTGKNNPIRTEKFIFSPPVEFFWRTNARK